MTAQVVTRCEVYMSAEEQRMLLKVASWIEEMDEDLIDMPECVRESLTTIYDEIHNLLELIPDEH
jgi:hypothetical protein